MLYVSFVLHCKMAAMFVFFSHRSRNGGNACFICLCSPVFVGEGGDRCKRSRDRNTLTTPPVSSPDHTPTPSPPRLTPTSTTPNPTRRCVSVRMKCEWSYWALEIINDKWSNCGSDDSSCKYWRKNLYHFILIIFLLFHITKWTAHAWVLGAQTRSVCTMVWYYGMGFVGREA